MERRPRGAPVKRELVDLASESRLNLSVTPPPLVHVTSVGWGRRIVDQGKMEAKHCSVFSKDLVYAFLARPAYRFRDGDSKSAQMSRFPFVVVLSPAALETPYHVYPFDTGAYMAGVYGTVPDPTLYLEDYELDPSMDSALRHVAWGFGSTSSYYDGTIRAELADSMPDWRAVGRSWSDIASMAALGKERPDYRASAIELAYSRSIDLRQGHARLFIFPLQLIEDPRGENTELLTKIKDLKVPTATYDWRANETPDSYAEIIGDIVRKFLPDESIGPSEQ